MSSSQRVKYATKEAMDNLVPNLDPNDYGKMPATYYANSQKVASTTIVSDVVEENRPNQRIKVHGMPPEVNGKSIRDPILPRNKYDGVDSDDETDEEKLEDDESEEEMPQVVGDVEIDMGGEVEDFLEFSRHALGISEKQWNEILRDRKERGGTFPYHCHEVLIACPAHQHSFRKLRKRHRVGSTHLNRWKQWIRT